MKVNRLVAPLKSREWELSLGISGLPLYAWEQRPIGVEYWLAGGPTSATKLYSHSFYARTSGMIYLQGAMQFHKRWAAVASLGYSHLDIKYVYPSTGATDWRDQSEGFTAFAGLRYYYVSRPAFKMYAAAQGGLFLHTGGQEYWHMLDDNPKRFLGGQFTFVGMQFGKKWFGEVELWGFGDYYTIILPPSGGRVGFGYRF